MQYSRNAASGLLIFIMILSSFAHVRCIDALTGPPTPSSFTMPIDSFLTVVLIFGGGAFLIPVILTCMFAPRNFNRVCGGGTPPESDSADQPSIGVMCLMAFCSYWVRSKNTYNGRRRKDRETELDDQNLLGRNPGNINRDLGLTV